MANRGGGTSDDSWMMKTHKAVKKANHSLIGYVSSKSHWPLPPVRAPPLSLSGLKPNHKNVEKILAPGLDLFRHKKHSTSEEVHELRLLDNRLIQWRFANARTQAVNRRMSRLAEGNLICAMNAIGRVRYSVMIKKIEFEREKLELKLTCLLSSQMQLLERWGSMKRQYLAAITILKDCLYSVACRVHLLDGAEVDVELASISQKQACDLADSMESMLSTFSPVADVTAELLSELAEVVAQERFILDEFDDMFETMCLLELEEKRLRCSLIQLLLKKENIKSCN